MKSPESEREDTLGLERLVFFSDAVFAIAITLLALELRMPASAEALNDAALFDALLATWPRILAFVVSFLVIGQFWIGHHRHFRTIRRYNERLLQLNLLLLLAVAFIPFPTAVISEHGEATGTIFYALSIALVGLLAALMWWYASNRGRLVDPPPDARERRREFWRALVVPVVFLCSIPLALFNTDLAKYSWLLILPLARLAQL